MLNFDGKLNKNTAYISVLNTCNNIAITIMCYSYHAFTSNN